MRRRKRSAPLPPASLLAASLLLIGCGDTALPGRDTGAEDVPAEEVARTFCEAVRADVDAFLAERREGWSPPPTEAERYGGTAVVSGAEDLVGMNPLVSTEYTTSQHQNFVLLMTLVRYDADLRPVPWLAESWELGPDSTTLTFHLRDDVFWHDGTPTTAHDVAFTFRRMTDPETGFANAAYWDAYRKGEEGVDVLDSSTVRFHFTRPHAEYLDAWRASPIVPAHLLDGVLPADLASHPYDERCPVGNGPFVFVEHRPGESWTFRANPGFPEELGGRPYLDRLVYRVIGEPATALTELLTGRTDVYSRPPATQADQIIDADGVRLLSYDFRNFTFVGWNARREQLADPRVRRALTTAIDREDVVEAVFGGYGRVAQTTVPPFHWAFDPTLSDALSYDPDGARRLLDEAGWTDRDGDGVRESATGTPLRVTLKHNASSTRRAIAELMQAQLREVGVQVVPRQVEYQTLIQQLTDPGARDFDGVVLGFNVEFKLDDRDLFHSERIDGLFAFAGTQNPELDRLMDTLQVVIDREAARELWSEYQRTLIEEQPFTFFAFAKQLDGVRERLRGVEMDVRGEWIAVDEWWIAPEDRRGSD